MLQAIEQKSGSLVIPALLTSAEREAWKKEKAFSCPDCQKSVILKTGTKVTPHFAHRAASSCPNRDGGEGEYHLKGKLQLYQWLENQHIKVSLETYLSEIQQRPDLFLEIGSRKIALEYQCAPITPASFYKRTNAYAKAGIVPIWIAGGNRQQRSGPDSLFLTANDKLFLHHYRTGFSPLLYFYCSKTRKMCFFSDIYFTGGRKNYGKLHYAAIQSLSFVDLFWNQESNGTLISRKWLEEKKKLRFAAPVLHQSRKKRWLDWLYRRGWHPGILPSIIGLPVKSQFRMKLPPAVWQSSLLFSYFLYVPVGSTISLSACRRQLASTIIASDSFPLVHSFSCPIEEYLELLAVCGILEKKEQGIYRKQKEINFPQNVETGLMADQKLYQELTAGKGSCFSFIR